MCKSDLYPVVSGAVYFHHLYDWPIHFALAYANHQFFLLDDDEKISEGECFDIKNVNMDFLLIYLIP